MTGELWHCPEHGVIDSEPGWTWDPEAGEVVPTCPVQGCPEPVEPVELVAPQPGACPVVADAVMDLRDALEEAMATSEPVAMVAAAVAMAERMADHWRALSRALSDEALWADPETMGEGAHAELMELGSKAAACELAGRAALAVAQGIAGRAGMHVDGSWPES